MQGKVESAVQAAMWTSDAMLRAASLTAGAALVASVFALIAALVAAHVATRNARLQARVTQQTKHADFRQDWINSLREKMVRFQALSYKIGLSADEKTECESLAIHILLLMNRADEDYPRLVSSLRSLPNTLPDDPAHGKYITLCQDILKREWNVTRADLYALPRGKLPPNPFPSHASSLSGV